MGTEVGGEMADSRCRIAEGSEVNNHKSRVKSRKSDSDKRFAVGANVATQSLAWHSRLQAVDHVPEAIDFSPFD
jgi:hypothetical protein